MKLHDNNIDVYFRTGAEDASLIFDREKAWKRFEQKRTRKKALSMSLVTVIILCLVSVILISTKRTVNKDQITDEFYKRQKLKEYEKILSGNYKEPLLCYSCNDERINPQNKQVPEEQWIFTSN